MNCEEALARSKFAIARSLRLLGKRDELLSVLGKDRSRADEKPIDRRKG